MPRFDGWTAWTRPLALVALLAPTLDAQSGYIDSAMPPIVVSQSSSSEYWIRAAVAEDGRTGFVFNIANSVFARFYDENLSPLTGSILCHPDFQTYIQDECEISVCSLTGNYLVCFNDRSGQDGQEMGIYARVFDRDGVPLGTQFQVNETWLASQWRPLIWPRPAGGWVVSWSGDWDGDAVMRVLDCNGAFLSGDIGINTFDNNAQVDTTHAIAPDGTMLVVYVDYSAHGGVGTGTNLWGRLYDQDGVPLMPAEVHINTPAGSVGHQREPRVAVDSQGNFLVVWQDEFADGSNYGIVARLYDSTLTPLGNEFLVNVNTAGLQRNPRPMRVAFDHWVIVWEDGNTDFDVVARRFANDGSPVSGEVLVHDPDGGDQDRPSLAADSVGSDVLICWETPDAFGKTDVHARVFDLLQPPTSYCTALVNSQGCTPAIGSTGSASLTGADDFHITAASVLNQKNGLMFWGTQPQANPFGGGFLCVNQPVTRTPVQSSGGNLPPDDCSGAYDYFFSQAYAAAEGVTAGQVLYAQYWSRDPTAAATFGLTDGLSFEVGP